MATKLDLTTGIVWLRSVIGSPLTTGTQVVTANLGVYVPGSFEIPNGVTYELSNGAVLEIG